jgi:rod shape-determining protein MreD
MRLTGVLVTVAVSLVLQTVLARYSVGVRWSVDLVLLGVIYSGLRWGPVAGMLAGTLGGLIQDWIALDIVGVGGLTKTLIGFAVGVIGAQFVLVRAHGRVIIVAVATILHRLILVGLYDVIGGRAGVLWSDILIQTGLNAAVALVGFQLIESLPGALERSRANRRATLNRRKW